MLRAGPPPSRQRTCLVLCGLLAASGLLLLQAVQALLTGRQPSIDVCRESECWHPAEAGLESQTAVAVGYSSAAAGAAAAILEAPGTVAVEHVAGLANLKQASRVFQDFLSEHAEQLEAVWRARLEGTQERGIVVAAGMPTTLANAFVGMHVLRRSLGCRLPVTIM